MNCMYSHTISYWSYWIYVLILMIFNLSTTYSCEAPPILTPFHRIRYKLFYFIDLKFITIVKFPLVNLSLTSTIRYPTFQLTKYMTTNWYKMILIYNTIWIIMQVRNNTYNIWLKLNYFIFVVINSILFSYTTLYIYRLYRSVDHDIWNYAINNSQLVNKVYKR